MCEGFAVGLSCEAAPWQALLVWLAAAACLAPFILRRRR